nr:MAG TPA: hypothetical protein [Caudoviricetes sp.]
MVPISGRSIQKRSYIIIITVSLKTMTVLPISHLTQITAKKKKRNHPNRPKQNDSSSSNSISYLRLF